MCRNTGMMITASKGGGLERDFSGLYEGNIPKSPTQTGQTLRRDNFLGENLLRSSIMEAIPFCVTNRYLLRGNEYSCVKMNPVF